jgi:hypothetical protein
MWSRSDQTMTKASWRLEIVGGALKQSSFSDTASCSRRVAVARHEGAAWSASSSDDQRYRVSSAMIGTAMSFSFRPYVSRTTRAPALVVAEIRGSHPSVRSSRGSNEAACRRAGCCRTSPAHRSDPSGRRHAPDRGMLVRTRVSPILVVPGARIRCLCARPGVVPGPGSDQQVFRRGRVAAS